MSLFEWSIPERRKVDQILPTVPNEIYLDIFDHITTPGTKYLTQEELKIFVNLSRVSRFFANVCLPRIYHFIEFSGCLSRGGVPTYKASQGSTLCAQITSQQPLALALARMVRLCHFTNLGYCNASSLASGQYIASMSHMKNVRAVQFSSCWMEAEHWRAIMMLPSLEELSFFNCTFQRSLENAESETKIKPKLTNLSMVKCVGSRQLIMAIDTAYLRTFGTDYWFVTNSEEEWLRPSSVTELYITIFHEIVDRELGYVLGMNSILLQVPQSLETLCFLVAVLDARGVAQAFLQSVSDNLSAWTDLSSLRSFTLRVDDERPVTDELTQFIDGMVLQVMLMVRTEGTLGFTLFVASANLANVLRILRDKFGRASSIKHVDYFGIVFQLVDGEWSRASRSLVQ